MSDSNRLRDLEVFQATSAFQATRLTLAREAQGLTQKELASRIDATPSAISQFESGVVRPSPETLARLSLALGYPPKFFSLGLGQRLQLDACHFRKLRATPKKDQRQVLARGDLLLSLVSELEQHVAFPDEQVAEHQADISSLEEVELLTERLRDKWGLGLGPISSMIGLLESLGVLVLELAGHNRQLDAFSTWCDDRPLVFLSSEKGSASRRRFDCAHELGHLLMHAEAEPGNRDLEAQADRFASAFLLPAESFGKEYPRRLSWGHLRALKRRWKVSLAAMIVRAYELGVITEATYRRAFVRLNRFGWRSSEPDEPELETSSLIIKAVQALAAAGERQLAQLAEAIALRQRTVEELVQGAQQQPTLSLSLA